MIETLTLAIGIGLVVSLLFSELFGLAAGGMVVPGYIGLYLTQPFAVVLTIAAGFLTFAVVHALASVVIIYGRRRTVLMILMGYLIGVLVRSVASPVVFLQAADASVIGYIIPGLIAIWMDRQGTVETVSTMLSAAVVVRLVLLLVGVELTVQ